MPSSRRDKQERQGRGPDARANEKGRTAMSLLKKFHKDEMGPPELSTVLLVAFIVVPLVGLLVFFGQELTDEAKKLWTDLFSDPIER
jgi:hypothetical protein